MRRRLAHGERLAVPSNGMLPRLIVLAPSASFSFNRDHYPPRESILLRVARKVHRAWMHTRNDIFLGLRRGTHPTYRRVPHLSRSRVSPLYGPDMNRVCRERKDAIPRLDCRGDQPTNVRVHTRFSPFGLSIQINSVCLVEAPDVALRGKDDQGRQHAALECIMMQRKSEQ